MINRCLVFLCFFASSFPLSVWAQYLPANELAHGSAEKVLREISVDKMTSKEIISLYGKATTIEVYPDDPKFPDRDGQRNYIWKFPNLKMYAEFGYYTDDKTGKLEEYPIAIDLNGAGPDVKTGRGLALGDDFSKMEKIYGKKFKKELDSKNGKLLITYQWGGETILWIEFNEKNKIDDIHLGVDLG